MTDINKLNVSQICSVKSFINARCRYYEYRKAERFLFWKKKEGYYYTMTFREAPYMSIEAIESNGKLFCKDEKVYYKPHLEIRMSDGLVHEKYFETEEELQRFMATDVMKGVNWINN